MSQDYCPVCDGRGQTADEPYGCDACYGTGLEPRAIDDVWTCSCGLTRPMTGSYGCADCGDGRPPMLMLAEPTPDNMMPLSQDRPSETHVSVQYRSSGVETRLAPNATAQAATDHVGAASPPTPAVPE